MILVTLFLLLISDTVGQESTDTEKYRFERLQGQCSAWCYATYGSWSDTDISDVEQTPIYQCLRGDEDCHSCVVGCSYEFNNLQECYSRCNNEPPCKAACKKHQRLSRTQINITQYMNDLEKLYPPEIYENPSKRSHDAIGLWWPHVHHYDNPTAVVFLVFLVNITTEDYDEHKLEKLYLGSTPHHWFTVEPLAPDYCYYFFMLSVSTATDTVIGQSMSNHAMTVDAIINVDRITTTSARIWFTTRPCETDITYIMHLVYGAQPSPNGVISNISLREPEEGDPTEKGRIAEPTNLIPNIFYKISVVRKKGENDKYSFTGSFTTKLTMPQILVKVKLVAIYDPYAMQLMFELPEDKSKMWDSIPTYYHVKITSPDREDDSLNITTSTESYEKEIQNLVPYTMYCVEVAVANSEGLGPYSDKHCNRTLSVGASRPFLSAVNVTESSVTLNITEPLQRNGNLTHYIVSYFNKGVPEEVVYPFIESSGLYVIGNLDAHTEHLFEVRANNSAGDLGAVARLTLTTLESLPELAPEITSCEASNNASHVTITVTWKGMDIDFLNGKATGYTLNTVAQDLIRKTNETIVRTNETYAPGGWQDHVIEVYEDELQLTKEMVITARLAVSTSAGQGPWSNQFPCEIVDMTGTSRVDITAILVPVFCVIALFLLLLLAFFYFFRFQTYKKTPYEEIKKLINPDAFSPCQHCMHNKEPKRWDVFICHVSEDIDYIQQLKEALVREKIDVFFAKDELSWGCELHRVINDGLRFSKYGLVVLSKQFVEKCSKWTSTELSSLHSKSRLSSQDCILPVWKKDVTEVEVGNFDMTLVGIKALKEEDMSVDQMAMELKKKLRNDGCWGCSIRKTQHDKSKGVTRIVLEDVSTQEQVGTNV